MMTTLSGITLTLDELIRARPPKSLGGFSPPGRVSTHQWGNNPSIFKGRGMEFAESRVYQVGDDVRNIDWRVTARTGETHTKLFQEERERPVQILVDLRRMMQFGTRRRFKSHLAGEIAAQLAWVAYDGGDRMGGQILTPHGSAEFRPTRTRRGVLRFLARIAAETALSGTDNPQTELTLASATARLRRVCRPGTLVFIISDFNDMDALLQKELNRLSYHSHTTLIQINDALDANLPVHGGRLSDGQHSVSLYALGQRVLTDYAMTFQQRQKHLQQLCARYGITYHHLTTTDTASSLLQGH
ncbi:MAG: DUF58 domain-containing protein [Gammaproteobacteria bacterium]|nr:MAG: DUF58 domain-containing protein [Gammaproteobacteria bacterium]